MNGSQPHPGAAIEPPHSPIDSVRQLASVLLAIFKTRAELLTIELQEEQERLVRVIVLIVVSIFSFVFTAILGTFFVVVLYWDTPYRMVVMGGVVLLFGAIGLFCGMAAALAFKWRPPLFGATLAELKKDSIALKQELS